MQGELADEQDAAIHIFYRQVGHFVGIIKNAEVYYFITQPLHVFCAVGIFNTYQHQQAQSYLAGDVVLYRYAGFGYPLYHYSHTQAN